MLLWRREKFAYFFELRSHIFLLLNSSVFIAEYMYATQRVAWRSSLFISQKFQVSYFHFFHLIQHETGCEENYILFIYVPSNNNIRLDSTVSFFSFLECNIKYHIWDTQHYYFLNNFLFVFFFSENVCHGKLCVSFFYE